MMNNISRKLNDFAMKKTMGSQYQIPYLIFFISIPFLLFNTNLFMASSAMEYNGDGKEFQISKVSGVDEVEEKRALILEKFRFLLGMRSFKMRRHHHEMELLSPSPAPSIEAEVPAPSPAPMVHTHLYSHSPPRRSRSKPISQPHEVQRVGERDKARVRRIVIAVAVSAGGVAFLLSALGFIFLCRKFRRYRKRGSKYASSTNKVSFDLGPEHFYLNSIEEAPESDVSHLKHVSENVSTLSEKIQIESSMDEKSENVRESVSDSVGEEIVSVHEVEEPNNCESEESNCTLIDKIVPVESFSSDDESFHSVCDSNSSDERSSNASEEDQSKPLEVCSPPSHSVTSPRLDHQPTLSFFTNSITPPLNSPCNLKQTSISSQHFPPTPPPPPPPPPPYAHFSPIKSLSSSTSNSSKMPKALSPWDSDSSAGSKSTTKNVLPFSPQCEPQKTSTGPPTSAKGIPAPPCPPMPPRLPPPSVKNQPPPPPPGQNPQYIPVGKDGVPLPKLKPLHWDKVRAVPDRSMIWDKLRSSSFELDEKMIESLFGQTKNDEAKSKTPSPSKHILEPKRLQNITILLKALNATPEQVCNALVQGEGLCLQQLEALVKMVPTNEEETKLSNYQGDINELGSAEKFVKAMLRVPFAFIRIETMLYRDTFEDEVVHLRKSFAMLEEACKELRSSRLFLKLLEAVLKTGNRMNVGTIRGGATAFKLDALLKLADVKGTDGKTTLLHFVVQEMVRSEGIIESESIMKKNNQKIHNKTSQEREEDYRRMGLDLVSGLGSELGNVKKTATIDLDVLASSVSNLSEGMVKLRHLVYEDLSIDQKQKFVQSMRGFLSYAEKNIKELKKDEDGVLLHVREITEYFHGNVSKDEVNPLRIFVIVRDFLGMLDQVCKEVRSMKIPMVPISIAPFQ